jgi:hypothetical protein
MIRWNRQITQPQWAEGKPGWRLRWLAQVLTVLDRR